MTSDYRDQPAGRPWPTESWPREPVRGLSQALDDHLASAFADGAETRLGETRAVVVAKGGAIIAERYGPDWDASRTLPSWSMAKSMTQALAGLLVADGRLDISAAPHAPEWPLGDPRRAITVDQLLRMSSGLAFVEDYAPGSRSDVIEMLFGAGKADVAAYAARRPLAHPPGAWWSYSSGTTNLISRTLSARLDLWGEDFARFMRARLFEPIGMRSPIPKFDDAGVFIGSSFCFCTAEDFARFGYFYLRGGVWEGRRLLPEAWIDYARRPTPRQPGVEDDAYGAHWWLGLAGEGSFAALGYEGQFTLVAPDLDLVVVRSGRSPVEAREALRAWIAELVAILRR